MRTLTSTLTSALRAQTRRPYLTATAVRRSGGVALLDWQQLATGSEAPGPVALAQLADQTVVRGRLIPATNQFLGQSMSNPNATSPWTVWPTVIAADATAIAFWAEGTTVYAAYVTTNRQIVFTMSSDGGRTFAAPTVLAAATTAPAAIAGATKPGGRTLLVWDDGAILRYVVRSEGVWSSAATAATIGGACTGLAAHYFGDFNCLLTGSDALGDKRLWSLIFGDGFTWPAGSWGPPDDILLSNAGLPVSYHEPTLAFADTYRFFYRERFEGNPPGNRAYWSHHQPAGTFIESLWREPVPFPTTAEFGPALAYAAGSYLYLATYQAVWRAALAPTPQDLTADLRRLTVQTDLFAGRAELTIANDAGRYAALGSGANAQLALGSELTLSLGYRTSAGNEVSEFPHVWITGADYRADRPNRADLILTAEDAWWILRRWTARRSFAWATGDRNVYQILAFLFARAGLSFTTSGASADLGDLYPAFTIYPGDTGVNVVRRLLALVPDYLWMTTLGAVAGDLAAAEPPAVMFRAAPSGPAGAGSCPILAGHYRSALRHFNHIQLHGNNVFGEALDFAEIGRTAGRLHQIHDLNVATTDLAASRAAAYLRDETIQSETDEITVPVHPGLEILDPIAISDVRAGLADAPRRVLGLAITYDPAHGRYEEVIRAGHL